MKKRMSKYLLTFIGSIIAGGLLITLPYYLLSEGSYIPKRIPILGYFMPQTPLAWFFLILGLAFFVIAVINLYKFKKQKTLGGKL